ncbi:alpha/beta fold hydrolase [Chloroflexota bacterium]
MMKIQANNISMNYEITGDRQYLTLLHGMGDNMNIWYQQVPAFSRHYRVLNYDIRGHGQTELPEGELDTDLWTEDLYALLRALNINKTILLGYSMGGGIAIRFTLDHPDMVSALVISGGGGGGEPEPKSEDELLAIEAHRQKRLKAVNEEGLKFLFKGARNIFSPGFVDKNPEVFEKYKEIILQNTSEQYIRVTEKMGQRPDRPTDLSKITCPTLMISGEFDPYRRPGNNNSTPNAKFIMIPTGHPTFLEQPEEFNDFVLKFLTESKLD